MRWKWSVEILEIILYILYVGVRDFWQKRLVSKYLKIIININEFKILSGHLSKDGLGNMCVMEDLFIGRV